MKFFLLKVRLLIIHIGIYIEWSGEEEDEEEKNQNFLFQIKNKTLKEL